VSFPVACGAVGEFVIAGADAYFGDATLVATRAVWSSATYALKTEAKDRTLGGVLTAVAIGAVVGSIGQGFGADGSAFSTAWEKAGPMIQAGIGNGVSNTVTSGLRRAGFDVNNLM